MTTLQYFMKVTVQQFYDLAALTARKEFRHQSVRRLGKDQPVWKLYKKEKYIFLAMISKFPLKLYVCMYIYVCTYVRMYVCMYVCTYVCTYVRMYVYTYMCMYVCNADVLAVYCTQAMHKVNSLTVSVSYKKLTTCFTRSH
jgi:hypothetical protein